MDAYEFDKRVESLVCKYREEHAAAEAWDFEYQDSYATTAMKCAAYRICPECPKKASGAALEIILAVKRGAKYSARPGGTSCWYVYDWKRAIVESRHESAEDAQARADELNHAELLKRGELL